jgi:hypothetical protein
MKRLAAVLLLGLALSACGKRQGLEPAAGAKLPPAPLGATAPRSADELIRPSTQARPNRIDEPAAANRRREDPFELPPG